MKRILVAAVAVVATAAWAQDSQTPVSESSQAQVQSDTQTRDTGALTDPGTESGIGGAGEAGQGAMAQDPNMKPEMNKPGTAKPEMNKAEPAKPEMAKTDAAKPAMDKKSGGRMAELGVMVPADANQFLNHLAHNNDMEIKMAQLASERATSKAVKAHAEKMVKDHTAMKEKLEALAKAQNLTLGEPAQTDEKDKTMMAAHMATMAKLEIMEGKAFDKAYLTAMLEGHDLTIAKAMVATEQFRDTELAKLLKKELPKLMEHRTLTYNLLGKEKPDLAMLRK